MKNPKQLSFESKQSYYQFNHGGILRKKRIGRKQRPLSTKESLHVVFKVDKRKLRFKTLRSAKSYTLIQKIIKTYAKRFCIQLEQVSIQNDHCHLLIRTKRRSSFHKFFRVVAGQIAQIFENEGLLLGVTDTPCGRGMNDNPRMKKQTKAGTQLWLYRPFSRVVRGYKAYLIVRDYIQLNEKEVLGQVVYRSTRLKGLLRKELEKLWS